MFPRIKKILKSNAHAAPALSVQPTPPCIGEFSIESLWDDYEKRTWLYEKTQPTHAHADARLLNWIGSIDHSGYIREKCLRELISSFVPGDENRILLRLTDWVPRIQSLAREWTLEFFAKLPFESIHANQRLLLYLSRKHRLMGDPSLLEIKRVLLERAKLLSLSEFLGLSSMFRRFLYSLSLADNGSLRPWILADPDPFNRLLLLTRLGFQSLTKEEIEGLAADKSVFVRRGFFREQLDAGSLPSREYLLALALDSNRSLRELGRFYLKKFYQEDAYAIYRAKCGEERFFIADYGRKEDSELFLEGICTGSRSSQYNCLRAFAATAEERFGELDLASLISQNRKFRAVVIPVLPRVLALDEMVALRPAFEGSSPYGIVSFLRALEKKSFWAFLDVGLDVLLADPPPAVRQSIIRTIRGKVEIWESLSVGLKGSISDKLSKLRNDTRIRNEGLVDLLEFMLKTA